MKTNLKNRLFTRSSILGASLPAIFTVVLAASAHAATYYWDTNNAAGFTNIAGAWNGTNAFWNTDITGATSGTFIASPTSADDLNVSAGATGTLNLSNTTQGSSFSVSSGVATTLGPLNTSTLAVGGTGALSGIFSSNSAGIVQINSAVTLNNGPITIQNTGTVALNINGTITGSQNLILNATNGLGFINLTNVNINGTIFDNGTGTFSNTLTTVGSGVTSVTMGTSIAHTLVLANLTVNSGGTTLTNNSVAAKALGQNMLVTGTGNLLLNGSGNFSLPFAVISSVNNTGNVTFAMTGAGAPQTITTVGGNVTGLINSGASTLTIGTATTFTGITTVKAGTLRLDFANAAAPGASTSMIGTGSNALALGGGTLLAQGKAATFNSQTFTSTTLDAGASAVTASRGDTLATSAMVINLGAITRNAGSTVVFSNPSLTNQALSASNGIVTSSGSASTTLLDSGVAYATLGTTNWAAKDSTNTWIVAATNNSNTASTLGSNSNTVTLIDTTLAADSNPLTMRNVVAETRTITAMGFTITTGGILQSIASGSLTITGGTLRSSATAANKDLVLINNGVGALTINSTIANAAIGNTGLTKSGTGIVNLGGANSYTGDTIINKGTLSLGTGTANTSLADGAGVVIGTDSTAIVNLNYSGTDTVASLTINGVAKAPGVYGSSDLSGRITGTGTLTVGAVDPYTTWAGGAGFYDDSNSDGVDNGLAWLLGAADPNVSALSLLPTPTVSGGNLTLSTFDRVNPKGSAKLFVEYSDDLSAWTPVETATANGVYTTGNITITIAGTSPQTVAVTVSSAAASGGKLFARLRATEN